MKTQDLKMIILLVCCTLILTLTGCGQQNSVPPKQPPSAAAADTTYYPVTVTQIDVLGNPSTYTYKKAPTRVVITHPGATELLLELGLDDRILSTIAPYGAPLERLAQRYAKLNIMQATYIPSLEEVLEMQPDMLIGWSHHFSETGLGDEKTWHERGVATIIMPNSLSKNRTTFDDTVYAYINHIGEVFGIQDKTDQYIAHFKDRLGRVEKAVKDVPQKKTVMVLQDHRNGQFSLYDNSYLINLMIITAGGKPIADDVTTLVSAEKILSYNPDVILFVSTNPDDSTKDLTDLEAIAHLKSISELKSMQAICKDHIINLPFFTVNSGGARTLDAIEKIAYLLYPERFK
ncbi:MAG: ABC-type transporter, periplasmic subunit [Sporomusa sp.]|nr:ABC-type transporter, periplasmic subunit [Sporomusa sp.]